VDFEVEEIVLFVFGGVSSDVDSVYWFQKSDCFIDEDLFIEILFFVFRFLNIPEQLIDCSSQPF
jgi:hypothetical protein